MQVKFCVLLFWMKIFLYVRVIQCSSKYTVIVPNTIYSNEKYTAAVTIHHNSQPCQVNVTLSGPGYNNTRSVVVLQSEVRHVEFDVPALEASDDLYYVDIESVNCTEKFQNTTEIFFDEIKTYEIIQTDKDWYKFGDDINFRVLFMDRDLKPVEPATDAVIWFKDSKYKTVKQITGFETINGVYTGKFKIPEQSVQGRWILGVKNGGRFDRRAYFLVDNKRAKYIVQVEANKSVSVKDGNLQIVVKANYITGEPLDGAVTVVLSGMEMPRIYLSQNTVNGTAEIDINVSEQLIGYITKSTKVSIVATVREKLSGDKISGTTHTFIHPYLYTVTCTHSAHDTCSSFEADKETDTHFQIKYLNGSYVNGTHHHTAIEFTYKEVLQKNPHYPRIVSTPIQPISDYNILLFKGLMNETGFVNLKVTLPELAHHEGYLHYYRVSYKYLDESRNILDMHPIKADKSSRNYFMLAKQSANNRIHLSKTQQFTVNSSQPLSYLIYTIVGSRNIVKSRRVDLPDKPKVYNLDLTPEHSWTPKFHLYVYYVDENGEYHYAEQTYHINEQPNPIIVTADEHTRPGEEVTLRIQTAADSFVGLMAIDRRVLLWENNKNSMLRQLEDLYDYSTFTENGISKFPGKSSGCVTLTNANYLNSWQLHSQSDFSGVNQNDVSENSPVKETFPVTLTSHDANHIGHTNSLETWIFEDFVRTKSAEFTWSKKLPATRNNWLLTAFSFHPSKGLGVTQKELKISTF